MDVPAARPNGPSELARLAVRVAVFVDAAAGWMAVASADLTWHPNKLTAAAITTEQLPLRIALSSSVTLERQFFIGGSWWLVKVKL